MWIWSQRRRDSSDLVEGSKLCFVRYVDVFHFEEDSRSQPASQPHSDLPFRHLETWTPRNCCVFDGKWDFEKVPDFGGLLSR